MPRKAPEWADGRRRCVWANPSNPAYVEYHDREWGVPVHDDGKLYEMLLLECFQAGLSWECILNKRDAFREAFDGFDPHIVAGYGDEDVERLLSDPGIVRNRSKIVSAIGNAKVFLDISRESGSFSEYIWGWTDGRTVHEYGVDRSDLSDRISEDLRRHGMRFVGSVTVYSYLQAVGIVWSHGPDCFLFTEGGHRSSRRSSSGSRSSARRSPTISSGRSRPTSPPSPRRASGRSPSR